MSEKKKGLGEETKKALKETKENILEPGYVAINALFLVFLLAKKDVLSLTAMERCAWAIGVAYIVSTMLWIIKRISISNKIRSLIEGLGNHFACAWMALTVAYFVFPPFLSLVTDEKDFSLYLAGGGAFCALLAIFCFIWGPYDTEKKRMLD